MSGHKGSSRTSMVIQVSIETVKYGGDGGWTITKACYDQPPPPEAEVTSGIFTVVGDMPPVAPGDLLRRVGAVERGHERLLLRAHQETVNGAPMNRDVFRVVLLILVMR